VSQLLINNNLKEYRRVVRIVKRGRLAGLISFDKVVDDTREARKTPSWTNIKKIMDAAVKQYRSDWWADQPYYVEVWLEKRALQRIFYPITNAYDVHLCVGGGYQSWSEVWEARDRFESRGDKKKIILYFGDLDPSGKDMPRDIKARFDTLGIDLHVEEVALIKNDVIQYNLPRNPAKKSDSRKDWYIRKYDIDYGVELDALPPYVLREKIEEAILGFCDLNKLLEKIRKDKEEKAFWHKIRDSNDFSEFNA
jgi:hypothetical protein